MDWIKVLNKHILLEYNDLRDSEFRAWIVIMALTAQLEHEPTREQMLQYVHYKTLDSLQKKLNTHSIDLQYVLNKVLIDAQYVLNRREACKLNTQRFRDKHKPVIDNVMITSCIREEKRREENKEKKGKTAPKIKLTDEEWLASLKSNPAYANLDIVKVKGKCEAWCSTKGKLFTRARFLNWLNREETPIAIKNPLYSKGERDVREYKPEPLPEISEEEKKRNLLKLRGIANGIG